MNNQRSTLTRFAMGSSFHHGVTEPRSTNCRLSIFDCCLFWFRVHAYNNLPEISFALELEARLNRIASQTGKGVDQIMQEPIASHLDHAEWFRQEVGKGLASLDSGKSISHEEVRRQVERILGS